MVLHMPKVSNLRMKKFLGLMYFIPPSFIVICGRTDSLYSAHAVGSCLFSLVSARIAYLFVHSETDVLLCFFSQFKLAHTTPSLAHCSVYWYWYFIFSTKLSCSQAVTHIYTSLFTWSKQNGVFLDGRLLSSQSEKSEKFLKSPDRQK